MSKELNTNLVIGTAALLFCSACGTGHTTGPSDYPHPPDMRRVALALDASPSMLLLGEPVTYSLTVENGQNCDVYLYFPSGLDDKVHGRIAKWKVSTPLERHSVVRWPVVRGTLVATAILVHHTSNAIVLQASVTISVQ